MGASSEEVTNGRGLLGPAGGFPPAASSVDSRPATPTDQMIAREKLAREIQRTTHVSYTAARREAGRVATALLDKGAAAAGGMLRRFRAKIAEESIRRGGHR